MDAPAAERPDPGKAPDCGKQSHLWAIPLRPGEKTVCRRCGKVRRGRRIT